jgi:hypothetical protein
MAIDTTKLAKMLALVDSPAPGERAAATSLITSMLAAAGKSWLDLPAIFGATQATPQQASATAGAPGGASSFRDFADFMEDKEPGYKAEREAERRQQARDQAAFRAALIARYGSEEAALAPTPMERAVDEAVAPFAKEEMRDYGNGRFQAKTLDGWWRSFDPAPQHVADAVRGALPLPLTVAAAKAEYDSWRERDRELNAIRGDGGDTELSLGCSLREQIVHGMLTHGLRATGARDAIVRWRFIMDSENVPRAEEMEAVLADLEHLAEMQTQAGRSAQGGQSDTTTARRAAVERLLSNLDTAVLPDREIARRVGVSPQTVGNIRRRVQPQCQRGE